MTTHPTNVISTEAMGGSAIHRRAEKPALSVSRMGPLYLFAGCLLAALLAIPAQGQWDLEESHTTASLRGIHNVGGGVAWASGTNGTVLRTEDGGYLWQTCATPPGAEHLDFRGIQAFDENTAIVMSSGKGDLSRLYKTTDGCKTWKLVFTNPDKDGFWDALKMASGPNFTVHSSPKSNSGVLIGDPVDRKFAIFLTEDAGEHWQKWETKGDAKAGTCGRHSAKAFKDESIFAASNEALLTDGGGLFFVTGGESGARLIHSDFRDFDGPPCWFSFSSQNIRSGKNTESSGAFAISATDQIYGLPAKIVIVGGNYKEPDNAVNTVVALEPKDPNRPFQKTFLEMNSAGPPPHGYRSAVAYDEKTKTWITVGPNGTDISTDDGKNWRPLHPKPNQPADTDKNWNALSPLRRRPNGRIGKLRGDALQP